MLLNRNNLAAGVVALKESETTRVALTGCRVSKHGTVASDSYRLVRIEAPNADEREYPVVQGMFPVNEDLGEVVLPGEALKAAGGALKRAEKHRAMPILANIQIGRNPTTRNVQLGTTDLETPQVIETRVIDVEFPDVDHVLTTEAPQFSIVWSAETFEQLAKLLKALNIGDHAPVSVHFWGPERMAYLTVETEEKQLVEYAAMPVCPTLMRPWEQPRSWSLDAPTKAELAKKAEESAATAASFETPPDWTPEQPAEAPTEEVTS